MKRYLLMAATLLPVLSGCATYESRLLNMRADLPHRIPHLTVDVSTIPLPKSENYHFDLETVLKKECRWTGSYGGSTNMQSLPGYSSGYTKLTVLSK